MSVRRAKNKIIIIGKTGRGKTDCQEVASTYTGNDTWHTRAFHLVVCVHEVQSPMYSDPHLRLLSAHRPAKTVLSLFSSRKKKARARIQERTPGTRAPSTSLSACTKCKAQCIVTRIPPYFLPTDRPILYCLCFRPGKKRREHVYRKEHLAHTRLPIRFLRARSAKPNV